MDELKPCPFCGYNMANEEDGAYQKAGFVGPQTPVWEVCCGSAACNASVSTTSRESAITAWNTRPRDDAGVVDEWRPIETAPNGQWFLVHSDKGWIGVARRADPDHAPGDGWFEDEHTEYVHPEWLTHWKPLPEPPGKANG